MTDFPLLASLFPKEAPAEPVTPEVTPEPDTQVNESLKFVGGDLDGKVEEIDSDTFTTKWEAAVNYTVDATGEVIELVVHATVEIDATVEDNSFGYSYGSENGTHSDISDGVEFKVTDVMIPQVEDNYDFFKLDPALAKEINTTVHRAFTSMDSDTILKYGGEYALAQVERHKKRFADNSPD